MAKQTLPVNFKDDILDPSMSGKRKFTITAIGDGTYEIEDVTDYTQTGSDFGAGQINATNQAVNESCDKANVIETMEDIVANQASGMIAGAKAVATLNAYFADSGWIEMTSSTSFAEKPMFRKIGKTVYVMGTIRYSDNGVFRNDEIIGDIPSEFIPSSSYGTYECIIPFAFISGSGSRERMYIRGNHVYFAGTSGARDGILAASCYLTD